jgi:RNA polymerase sigma-70 factor (sigma-E family)
VADDIITLGGPEGQSRRKADQSVELLFHAHYPRMVYTAFSLVGDWDLAEQLAQEAYLRLWRRWRWISDPQAAPMYLQRTIVNLSRETIRRKIIERRALRAKDAERPVQPGPDPAAVVELRRAIASLPVSKRECVVLRFLLGMSEAETAELLGVSVGTVKSQTHKGLRLLRERLDDDRPGTPAAAKQRGGRQLAWPRGVHGSSSGQASGNGESGRNGQGSHNGQGSSNGQGGNNGQGAPGGIPGGKLGPRSAPTPGTAWQADATAPRPTGGPGRTAP